MLLGSMFGAFVRPHGFKGVDIYFATWQLRAQVLIRGFHLLQFGTGVGLGPNIFPRRFQTSRPPDGEDRAVLFFFRFLGVHFPVCPILGPEDDPHKK